MVISQGSRETPSFIETEIGGWVRPTRPACRRSWNGIGSNIGFGAKKNVVNFHARRAVCRNGDDGRGAGRKKDRSVMGALFDEGSETLSTIGVPDLRLLHCPGVVPFGFSHLRANDGEPNLMMATEFFSGFLVPDDGQGNPNEHSINRHLGFPPVAASAGTCDPAASSPFGLRLISVSRWSSRRARCSSQKTSDPSESARAIAAARSILPFPRSSQTASRSGLCRPPGARCAHPLNHQ